MASKAAIAGVLAYLRELYPHREVTTATADAFHIAFSEWDDAELQRCATNAAAEPGRKFFPNPGEIAAHRRPLAVIDGSAILRRVSALGLHNTQVGFLPPNVPTVRLALGDEVADAFAQAGPQRLFSDDETTRSIAQREFQKSLTEYANNPVPRVMIEAPEELRRLVPRDTKPEALSSVLARALPPGTAA